MKNFLERNHIEIERPPFLEKEDISFDFFKYAVEITLENSDITLIYIELLDSMQKPRLPNMNFHSVVSGIIRSDFKRFWDQMKSNSQWYQYLAGIERLYKLHDAEYFREDFSHNINLYCLEHGIPWKFVADALIYKGSGASDEAISKAHTALQDQGYEVAARELNGAWRSLSARPDPDVNNAIARASQAAEAFIKKKIEVESGTLATHLKSLELHPNLSNIIKKMWGYASDTSRHPKEGHTLELEDAEISVAFWACVINYLMRRDEKS